MVTKGVLKDHLVLLANSMTCAGNLVGFNAGGIKALSRSLNVQIPFTEATLFVSHINFLLFCTTLHFDNFSRALSLTTSSVSYLFNQSPIYLFINF